MTFAQRLYGVTALDTAVIVTDSAPATPGEALALAASPQPAVQLASD